MIFCHDQPILSYFLPQTAIPQQEEVTVQSLIKFGGFSRTNFPTLKCLLHFSLKPNIMSVFLVINTHSVFNGELFL